MPSERWTYAPAPARRKKTSIVRSRTGCHSCRTRRKKCDEQKPVCTRCAGSGVECRYGNDTVEFRHANEWAAQQVKRVRGDRLNLESASSSSAPSPSNASWAGQSLHSEPLLVGPARLLEGQPGPDSLLRQPSSPSESLPNKQTSLSPIDASQDTRAAECYGYNAETSTQDPGASGPGCNVSFRFISSEDHRKPWVHPTVGVAATQGHRRGCFHDESLCLIPEVGPRNITKRKSIAMLAQWPALAQLECLHSIKQWQDAFPGNVRPHDAASIFINNRRHIQPTIFPNLSYPGLTSNDHSYLAHFTNHVAHILPTSTETIMSVLSGSYLARYAAMAISAANLANLRGTFVYDSPLQSGYSWIPDSRHRFRSLAYAGKALEIATDCRSKDISTLLAAHLMLTFVELELGSFEGLRYYISTVDGLVYNTHNQLLREKHGPEILCGLFDARSVQKFVAGPIGPPSGRELMMDQFWQTLEIRMPIKPDVAQSLGCEMAIILERLCLLTTMQHHLTIPNRMQYIVMKQLSDYLNTLYPMNRNEQISKHQLVSAYQECLGDMTGIRDQVLSLPTPPGVPLLSDVGSQSALVADLERLESTSVEGDEPLRFESHRESMIAADYAWCRILCDESIILGITNPSGGPLSPISPNASHWMNVLVRIARGIDISECSTKNIYRRGICGMLLHSAIRCCRTKTIDVLEDLLDRLISNGSAWEDCMFSNTPSVSTVRAVQRQLEQGRSILMVSSLDENVSPRTTIMSNRMVRTLILHGWEADGRTFDETLHLDDFATALGTRS